MRVVAGEMEQRRENLKACIVLTARLDGRDLGSAVSELQRQFKQKLHLPQGCTVSFGGAYEEQQQSFSELTMILALMPLALGFGMGAQMQQPLAVAVIGGFVAALPLLLVVLPWTMRLIYKHEEKPCE